MTFGFSSPSASASLRPGFPLVPVPAPCVLGLLPYLIVIVWWGRERKTIILLHVGNNGNVGKVSKIGNVGKTNKIR